MMAMAMDIHDENNSDIDGATTTIQSIGSTFVQQQQQQHRAAATTARTTTSISGVIESCSG